MNNNKVKSTFEKTLKQALFFSSIFGFVAFIILSLYKSMDTVIERAFVLMTGAMLLFPLIPIVVTIIINSIINTGKRSEIDSKGNYNSIGVNIPKPKSNNTTELNKPQLKVVTTQGYTEFNNILKVSVKNKLLNRQSILQLKCELRYRLGTHIEVYKDFKFENDLHELYTLSKSSVLTKEDYEYLTQFISNNLNLPKEA